MKTVKVSGRRAKRRAGGGASLNRREFIGGSTVATAAASALWPKLAREVLAGGPAEGGGFDQDIVLLVQRITGGFSVPEYDYAASLGYEGYLAEQLDYLSLIDANDPDLQMRLTPPTGAYDILDMSALEIRTAYQPMNMSNIALRQTTTVQLMQAVYGRAQLYFRMFQFWNHHLNIDINSTGTQRFILWPFLRDVVLANCMENAPDLIRASAHGSAMLYYLNNNINTASAPNENYARELMELHTLGVDNGYDQGTIEEVARILTGWSVCLNAGGCSSGMFEYGDFRFVSGSHDEDDKILTIDGIDYPIMGQSGTAGIDEGEQALTILTEHPNAAEFIATKLCRFFLGGLNYGYDPPSDVVQMVTSTYLNSTPIGDMRSMLEIILHRDVLTQLSSPKFRRPYDLTTAGLRAVGAEMAPTSPGFLPVMRFQMSSMGMHPNFWGPPNGPLDTKSWSEGNMVPRWAFVDALANNEIVDVANFAALDLLDSVNATGAGTQAEGLNALLTGGRMAQKEVEAIQDFIGFGGVSESKLKEALALAMSLPTFQMI